MALSGSINGSVGSGSSYNSYIRYDWSATQSIANNTSTITANLYLIIGAGTSTNASETGNIYIDGAGNTYNNGTQARSAGTYFMGQYIRTINHNSDGTKTFSFSGQFTSSWSYFGSLYVSGTQTLDTIPRRSHPTLSASSANIGQSITVYTNRASTSFTHTLQFWFPLGGSEIKVLEVTGVTDSYVFNTASIASTLYAQIPNANSGLFEVDCYTYSGGTPIGGNGWVQGTLNVTASNPTFTNFTYLDTNSTTTTITGNNQYLIQGYSTLRAVITSANKAVAINSATMSKYTFNINGATVEQAYATTDINKDIGVISASSNQTLTINAIDSRVNSTAVAKTVNMVAYSAPVVNASATRLNNFDASTTLVVSGSFSLLNVNGTNKNTIGTTGVQYRYRQDGGTWGAWTPMTRTLGTGTFTTTNVPLTLANTSIFDFEIKATDVLATTTYSLTVGKGLPLFMISNNLNSVGVGKMPTVANTLEVAGNLVVDGNFNGTNLGRTGNLGLDQVTNTAAEWSALPVGYSMMMAGAVIGTGGGAPTASDYGYFTKTANRDSAGGWGGIWVGYDAVKSRSYIGRSLTSSALPNWESIITNKDRTFMSINFNTSPVTFNFAVAWTSYKMPLNQVETSYNPDNRLSLNSNGIRIGAGVTKVRAGGLFSHYNNTSGGDFMCSIQKTSTNLGMGAYFNAGTAYVSYNTMPVRDIIIDVVEGDIIYLYCSRGGVGNVSLFGMTSLWVEVIQ